MYLEINNPMAYQAALYVRLSKEDESEESSQSITNQKSLLYEFAEKHRLMVYDIYEDDGYSGTSFDRPDFNRMIQDIEAHKVNMVITKDLSRLGRDYIMTGHYMERYFPEHNVRYISLLDGIDTGVDSTANDITPFRAIMNDMYAKDISRKIKSVKHDKQKKGLFIGWKPPYGYKSHPNTTNKLIIDEEAAAVVRRIFSMALDGISFRMIALILNDEEIPASSTATSEKPGSNAGLWTSRRISEMLQNEMYIGNMIQGRVLKVNYKSRKYIRRPPEQWIKVEHTHEPIIDEDTFRKVSLMIKSKRSTRDCIYESLLKGIVFCHECQTPLTIVNRPYPAGNDHLYFVCRTYYQSTTAHICSSHYILEQRLTNAVFEKIREICNDYLKRADTLSAKEKSEALKNQQRSADEEIASIENSLTTISANLDQMYTDRLSGLLASEDFQRIYEKTNSEQEQLSQRLKQIQEQIKSPAVAEDELKELAQRFIQESEVSRELLISLVERIELNKSKKFRIIFRSSILNNSVFFSVK